MGRRSLPSTGAAGSYVMGTGTTAGAGGSAAGTAEGRYQRRISAVVCVGLAADPHAPPGEQPGAHSNRSPISSVATPAIVMLQLLDPRRRIFCHVSSAVAKC